MSDHSSRSGRLIGSVCLAGVVLGSVILQAPFAHANPSPTGTPLPVLSVQPQLSAIVVHPGGTQASIEFTSSEPVSAKVTAKAASAAATDPVLSSTTLGASGAELSAPVTGVSASNDATPTAHPADPVHSPGNLGAVGAGLRAPVTGVSVSNDPVPSFETAHSVQFTNLKSNTTYDVNISGQTQSGTQLSGQAHFTTLKQRVLIYLDTIEVSSTGALFGDGSTTLIFGVNWRRGGNDPALGSGSANVCTPNDGSLCQYGAFGIGTHSPTNSQGRLLAWVFPEENFDFMPSVIALSGEAATQNFFDDIGDPFGFTGPPIDVAAPTWQVPQDVENLSTSMTVSANSGSDSSDFQSKATFRLQVFYDNDSYSAAKRNAPVSSW